MIHRGADSDSEAERYKNQPIKLYIPQLAVCVFITAGPSTKMYNLLVRFPVRLVPVVNYNVEHLPGGKSIENNLFGKSGPQKRPLIFRLRCTVQYASDTST
jgi:hypothetical protein